MGSGEPQLDCRGSPLGLSSSTTTGVWDGRDPLRLALVPTRPPAEPRAPAGPGLCAPCLDRARELRVSTRQRHVFLAEPAALGHEHEHADEGDEQTWARDPGDRKREPERDEDDRCHPSRDSLREAIDRLSRRLERERRVAQEDASAGLGERTVSRQARDDVPRPDHRARTHFHPMLRVEADDDARTPVDLPVDPDLAVVVDVGLEPQAAARQRG